MSREIYRRAVSGREDMSSFMIHLTRDDSADGEGWYDSGFEAKENFRLIAEQKCLRAYKPHCLHRNKLWDLREDVQNAFKVICFTEAPLKELHHLVKLIPGRKHKLEAYGYVFRREFIVAAGAQKVMYINEYDPFNGLRGPIDALFDMAHRNNFRFFRVLSGQNSPRKEKGKVDVGLAGGPVGCEYSMLAKSSRRTWPCKIANCIGRFWV